MTVTHTQGTNEDYVAMQPHHVQRILGMLQAAEIHTEYWIDALNKGIVTIETDSSVANCTGYYTTVMYTHLQQICFQGPCNGAKLLMMSYQTELAGVLATVYLLHILSSYSQMQITTKQTILCDNKAVISRANITFGPEQNITLHQIMTLQKR
eukprot:4399422-Ditylum_brightwellii.AAC.1